jgi:hypothetical protein
VFYQNERHIIALLSASQYPLRRTRTCRTRPHGAAAPSRRSSAGRPWPQLTSSRLGLAVNALPGLIIGPNQPALSQRMPADVSHSGGCG